MVPPASMSYIKHSDTFVKGIFTRQPDLVLLYSQQRKAFSNFLTSK